MSAVIMCSADEEEQIEEIGECIIRVEEELGKIMEQYKQAFTSALTARGGMSEMDYLSLRKGM